MLSPRKTQVVIVGGSSGANVAAQLSKARARFDPAENDLILISQLPYHIHLLAGARLITTSEGNLDSASSAFIPFDHIFTPGNAGRFVQGKVIHVFEDHVELEDGQSISFDFLVLGLGSRWPAAMNYGYTTDQEVQSHVKSWRDSIALANSVVVIGGGSVGIELAAEIKHYYPRKTVTIVQGAGALLNSTYPDKFRNKVAKRVRDMGINVILSEKIIDIPPVDMASGPASAKTAKNLELVADLFIPCYSPVPNTAAVQFLHFGTALVSDGHVRVTPTLNVSLSDGTTLDNVWAVGDIISWKEQHQLPKANIHADVVAYNVLEAVNARATGKKPKTKEYKGFFEAMFLPLGPDAGIGYLPFLWGIIVPGWIVVWVKSANLFINQTRSTYGLKK